MLDSVQYSMLDSELARIERNNLSIALQKFAQFPKRDQKRSLLERKYNRGIRRSAIPHSSLQIVINRHNIHPPNSPKINQTKEPTLFGEAKEIKMSPIKLPNRELARSAVSWSIFNRREPAKHECASGSSGEGRMGDWKLYKTHLDAFQNSFCEFRFVIIDR